jgi:hypothetical protein
MKPKTKIHILYGLHLALPFALLYLIGSAEVFYWSAVATIVIVIMFYHLRLMFKAIQKWEAEDLEEEVKKRWGNEDLEGDE